MVAEGRGGTVIVRDDGNSRARPSKQKCPYNVTIYIFFNRLKQMPYIKGQQRKNLDKNERSTDKCVLIIAQFYPVVKTARACRLCKCELNLAALCTTPKSKSHRSVIATT